MPEYLAPGVYVEEAGYRARTIVGVETATAVFLGVAADGKPAGPSDPLTALGDFARAFPAADPRLADGVAAFFDNGGRRLHVVLAAPGDWTAALDATILLGAVAIVAAPGLLEAAPALVAHAEAQSRFAIVDPPAGLDLDGIRAWRARFDTSHAALYYPWIRTARALQAPSGFVAGLYARNDADRGVSKAPANIAVIGAIDLETALDHDAQDMLNPLGINCIVRFAGRGVLVWGARTMTADPEWAYVNVRRYLLYLEASIRSGIGWVVFEPNGPQTWAEATRTVSDFLLLAWKAGVLLGKKPEEAFFVRCDRSTMTQADLDAGRLVLQIGIAPLRPAEFIVVSIGFLTASHDC